MKRADLKIGFACNNHCRFCVQGRKREILKSKTLAEAKKEIDKARADCQEIVFTGGEPTIHPNFLELVAYAKKKGFQAIQIQSNGRMFAYRNFCEQTIAAGASEFSPALHGHIAQLHDFLTSAPGSFSQTVQGIKNLKLLGQKVIANTVITKPNYRHLPETARLMVNLGVDQYQFAFVHPLGNAAENFDSIVPRMAMVEPFVKRGLDIGIKAGKTVMTEAIPYCFMRGYEKYIAEEIIPATKIFDFGKIDYDFTATRQKEGKKKGPDCKKCGFFNICEGPWREYPEKFGWPEFNPIIEPGKKNKKAKSGGFLAKIDNIFEFLIRENQLTANRDKIKKIFNIIFCGLKELKNLPKVEFSFSITENNRAGLRFFAHPHYLWKEYSFGDKISDIFSLFGEVYPIEKLRKLLTLSYLDKRELVVTFGLEWLSREKYPRLKIFFERPGANNALLSRAEINEICSLLDVNPQKLGIDKNRRISVLGIDFFSDGKISIKVYSQEPAANARKILLGQKTKNSIDNSQNLFKNILADGKGAVFISLQRFAGDNRSSADKIYKIYNYDYTAEQSGLEAAEKEIEKFFKRLGKRAFWKEISRWKAVCLRDKLRVCPVSISFENGEIGLYYYCQGKN